jgi:hypothetical protein
MVSRAIKTTQAANAAISEYKDDHCWNSGQKTSLSANKRGRTGGNCQEHVEPHQHAHDFWLGRDLLSITIIISRGIPAAE